jgi:uridine kinase
MKMLFEAINRISQEKDRIVISIDGRCASGKTTLSEMLQKELNATVFHMDDFFLPESLKTKERLSSPGGNVHYERVIEELLEHINDDVISFQKFDCTSQKLASPEKAKLSDIVIIEGVYSQQNLLRNYYDINVFVTIDSDLQKDRLKKRSLKMYNRFIKEWIPLEEIYFLQQNIERRADVIISV